MWLDDGTRTTGDPGPAPAPGHVEPAGDADRARFDGAAVDGDTGDRRPRRSPLVLATCGALLAGVVLVAGPGGVDDGVRDLVAPRPDAVLVLDGAPADAEPEVDSRQAARARELAGRARRTWEATLAGLPVAPTPQLPSSSHTAAAGDAAWAGRTGVRWTVTTALGEDAQWSLAADVADIPPAPRAFRCRPETWGLPGGRVLACEVTEPAAGVSELRAEAVLSSSPPRAWASPSRDATQAGADPQALPGYQRVVEVREGTRRVQVRLLRRMEGDSPAPLDVAELAAIAADPRWSPGRQAQPVSRRRRAAAARVPPPAPRPRRRAHGCGCPSARRG